MNERVNELYNEWLDNVTDELREEMLSMSDEEKVDAFYQDLSFGTGGMRGVIGAGTNRMNIFTLRRANYGYGEYILSKNQDNPSVVIAYDSRHKSLEFSEDSACVLASLGIKVYLFPKIAPTPELSFAVMHLKASGGIVVTASHNPPKYNGYKIYDDHGCQLVPELADIVIDNINKAPNTFDIMPLPFDTYLAEGLIEYVTSEVDDAYLENVKSISVVKELDHSNIKVVFSPLHGTSAVLGKRLLTELGYNIIPVEEQMIPDPNFSTLVSPNPEVMSAFDLSLVYAKKHDADICIATDPDADRVGLAVKGNDGYTLLTGNQTGAILIYYIVNNKKTIRNGVVFNTIVTSDLGASIARHHNLDTFSTLTGFKYIGEQAIKLENTDKEFVFGYEESYGYVVKDFVHDKDSLQALLLCAEAASFYKHSGKTLIDVLNNIYKEYGYYQEDLVNIGLEGEKGAKRIIRILDHFRNTSYDSFGERKVIAKEDYETSKRTENGKHSKLTLPKSNVIKYFLEDGSWFVLRPSGTEPKMKIYIATIGKSIDNAKENIEEIKKIVLEIIESIR